MRSSKKVALLSIALSSFALILVCFKSFPPSSVTGAWLNLGAGLLAILAIICVGSEYFSPPKPGDNIRAPDKFTRVTAGLTGLTSGVFWVASAWYGIFPPPA
ncbi:hypothetical protein [Pseudomonas sp. NFACC39-1]|uniref:hypothetical protein n=1 Tax=Pseudomonas sp. NFACC39-1 TaxID=1566195 RepID=UPI00116065E3|nr:hypothetical protein [Pseudomonas sp. NFACC39-1]